MKFFYISSRNVRAINLMDMKQEYGTKIIRYINWEIVKQYVIMENGVIPLMAK